MLYLDNSLDYTTLKIIHNICFYKIQWPILLKEIIAYNATLRSLSIYKIVFWKMFLASEMKT